MERARKRTGRWADMDASCAFADAFGESIIHPMRNEENCCLHGRSHPTRDHERLCMKYFKVEPEVSGGVGAHTVMDRSTHPPIVSKLHYEFDGWAGDALLEGFPSFIVTMEAKHALESLGATGIEFDSVEVSTSGEFEDIYGDMKLPPFAWMKVHGEAGQDDFGLGPDLRLVVSERALDALSALGMAHALTEPLPGS
jgi:hypothetical protein